MEVRGPLWDARDTVEKPDLVSHCGKEIRIQHRCLGTQILAWGVIKRTSAPRLSPVFVILYETVYAD